MILDFIGQAGVDPRTAWTVFRRQSTKTSRGRQKNDYNREFEKLLKQVESGAGNFLDTYDVELDCL